MRLSHAVRSCDARSSSAQVLILRVETRNFTPDDAWPAKRKPRSPSPTAALEAKAPRIAPAALISVAALPIEVLCEVFYYAPFRARLRAVSLVCKRWRMQRFAPSSP